MVHATGQNHSVAVLPKGEWSHLLRPDGSVTELTQLPSIISNPVLKTAEIVSIASGIANPNPGLMVARYDPNDAPSVINVDQYTAIEDLAAHPIYPKALQIAGVCDTHEIRASLKDFVFVVKEEPDPNFHWFQVFPQIFIDGLKKENNEK
jgi:hypothetical protein